MKKTTVWIAYLLCVAMLLSGCLRVPTPEETDSTAKTAEEEKKFVSVYQDHIYTYQTEVNEAALLTGLDPLYLLLANKQNALENTHTPSDLTTLTCATYTGKTIQLDARAAEALYEMLDEMHAAGVTDILVTSGYRSYDYQQSLFYTYLQREMSGISEDARKCLSAEYIREQYEEKGIAALSREDAERVVLSYSARPGTSEHQTGLCVDFITSAMSGLTTDFEHTPAFSWLRDNAYRFGFILRYPNQKDDITGYTYEPWHYRFVGREAATDIALSGLTLEEYLIAVQG